MIMKQESIDYSVVIPVYFNEGSLTPTMKSLQSDVIDRQTDLSGEIIFVDDGSGDGSFDELMVLRSLYPELVKVIKLTRNFGQVNALTAGFSLARGKCVVAMSADGQDSPRLINDMLSSHFEEGYEIVICTRKERDESAYRIVSSRLFYGIMRRLVFPGMPTGGFDYALIGRRALDVMLKMKESNPFLQGQIMWTGFTPKLIHYRREARTHGTSRWTIGRKVTYLIDGILSYSFFPIRLISILGIFVAFVGFAYALIVLIARLFGHIPTQGWAPLMIVMLVIGGMQMLMLGVIGEYVWRALEQARKREPFVIEQVFD